MVPKRKGLIKNYFETTFEKNILISYIEEPFRSTSINTKHTNQKVSIVIAEIFKSLRYNVDIINFYDKRDFKNHNYHVVWGFGLPFINCIKNQTKKTTSIYHGTGCSLEFQNNKSLIRLKEFQSKTNNLIFEGSRIEITNWEMGAHFSDAIVVNGNEFSRKTFYNYLNPKNIHTLKLGFFKVFDINFEKKNFEKINKNFLWFGGFGAIHKGLDILLDIFKNEKGINLFVAGISKESSPDFINLYREHLFHTENIHFLEFIDLKSETFIKLMYNNCFTIFPSVSEGGNPSTLTAMGNGGLIPIVTQNCAIDTYGFGIEIKEITYKGVLNSIKKALKMSDQEIRERSKLIYNKINEDHSFELFEKNTKKLIINILEKSNIDNAR